MCRALNYFEHFLILVFAVCGCASVSAFATLVGIHLGVVSCAVELNIFILTAGIKKHTSIIKKKKLKHDNKVLLAKTKKGYRSFDFSRLNRLIY